VLFGLNHSVAKANVETSPKEMEGPFYPVAAQQDKDFDLTKINGNMSTAIGKHIIIVGHVPK